MRECVPGIYFGNHSSNVMDFSFFYERISIKLDFVAIFFMNSFPFLEKRKHAQKIDTWRQT